MGGPGRAGGFPRRFLLLRNVGIGLVGALAVAVVAAWPHGAPRPVERFARITTTTTTTPTTTTPDAAPVGADVSSNWAGYVATGLGSTSTTASPSMSYTDVTGQWVEPKATCTGVPTSVALWVGLGGYSVNSQELEQAGTSADCHANRKASYYAWYELVPATAVDIKLKIDPGDTVAAAVKAANGQILVQITDRTRGTRFTKRLPMTTPDLTSAEWIAEAPSECSSNVNCQQTALTDFGSVNFTRTFATGNGIGGTITSPNWMSIPIELVPRSSRVFGGRDATNPGPAGAGAVPVGLAADGSGFTVEWQPNASAPS